MPSCTRGLTVTGEPLAGADPISARENRVKQVCCSSQLAGENSRVRTSRSNPPGASGELVRSDPEGKADRGLPLTSVPPIL